MTRADKINQLVRSRQDGIIIIENPNQQRNVQSSIRSAECFGFPTVYLVFETKPRFNHLTRYHKIARKWVEVVEFPTIESCIDQVKSEGYEVIATAITPGAENIHEADFRKKVAVLVGNERDGLSEKAMNLADKSVYIPMQGMIPCLNVTSALSIVLYEITRQRLPEMQKYLLSDQKANRLEEYFRSK